jgi:hypothetical protein
MADAGDPGHGSDDLDLANIGTFHQFIADRQIVFDCLSHVGDGFCLGPTLGPTSWKARNGHTVTIVGPLECDFVVHLENLL